MVAMETKEKAFTGNTYESDTFKQTGSAHFIFQTE